MEATATRRAFCCNHLKAATKVQIPTSPTSPECRCKNGHSGGGDTWQRQDPVVGGHPPAGNEGTKWPVSPFSWVVKLPWQNAGVVSRVLMVLPRISTCSSTSLSFSLDRPRIPLGIEIPFLSRQRIGFSVFQMPCSCRTSNIQSIVGSFSSATSSSTRGRDEETRGQDGRPPRPRTPQPPRLCRSPSPSPMRKI